MVQLVFVVAAVAVLYRAQWLLKWMQRLTLHDQLGRSLVFKALTVDGKIVEMMGVNVETAFTYMFEAEELLRSIALDEEERNIVLGELMEVAEVELGIAGETALETEVSIENVIAAAADDMMEVADDAIVVEVE
jgi:hypothetical protein